MSDVKHSDVIQTVQPHTITKCKLIEEYVTGWAYKILNSNDKSRSVIFIDCMSNCGVYNDAVTGARVDGTAVRVARVFGNIIQDYKGRKFFLYFNDIDSKRVEILKENIDILNLPSDIEVSYKSKDCNLFLKELFPTLNNEDYNILLLYDPYEATIDWEAVTPYLNCWGEVIINHMESDTKRAAKVVKNPQKVKKYESTYQLDIRSIVERLENNSTKDELNKVIRELIEKYGTEKNSNIFVASFPFFTRTNGLLYSLFYCSHSLQGFILFKDVAWKTFGDKSSIKNTHGLENQIELMMDDVSFQTHTDFNCYYVKDIALDLCEKYKNCGEVGWDDVYQYLDRHPIFPSKGYKEKIKKELRVQGIKIDSKNKKFIFS